MEPGLQAGQSYPIVSLDNKHKDPRTKLLKNSRAEGQKEAGTLKEN